MLTVSTGSIGFDRNILAAEWKKLNAAAAEETPPAQNFFFINIKRSIRGEFIWTNSREIKEAISVNYCNA